MSTQNNLLHDGLTEVKHIIVPKCKSVAMSENGMLAINTSSGVHIVALDATALHRHSIRRYYIPCNATMPMKYILSADDNSLLWKLESQSANRALSCPESRFYFCSEKMKPILRDVIFSPQHNFMCYVGCLSLHGSLEVYQWSHGEWVLTTNATECLIDHIRESLSNPTTWDEWYQTMSKGTITAFGWLKAEEQLCIILGTKCGNCAVFQVLENSKLQFLAKLETGLADPCTVDAFSLDHKIYILFGFLSGEVIALIVESSQWQVYEKKSLWTNKDALIPWPILSFVNSNEAYVVVNKRYYYLKFTFRNGDVTPWESEEFPEAIYDIKIFQNTVFIVYERMKIVKISLIDNEIIKVCDDLDKSGNCQGVVQSKLGVVWAFATAAPGDKSRLAFFADTYFMDLTHSQQSLERITHLSDAIDILWLRKLMLLQNDSEIAKTSCPNKSNKLRYWELCFKMSCVEHGQDVEVELRRMEETLAKLYTDNQPTLRQIFDNICKGNKINSVCELCSSTILHEDAKLIKCSKGHILPRCTISFNPCMNACFAMCSLCDAVADGTRLMENILHSRCPYCGGIFLMKNLVQNT